MLYMAVDSHSLLNNVPLAKNKCDVDEQNKETSKEKLEVAVDDIV